MKIRSEVKPPQPVSQVSTEKSNGSVTQKGWGNNEIPLLCFRKVDHQDKSRRNSFGTSNDVK